MVFLILHIRDKEMAYGDKCFQQSCGLFYLEHSGAPGLPETHISLGLGRLPAGDPRDRAGSGSVQPLPASG